MACRDAGNRRPGHDHGSLIGGSEVTTFDKLRIAGSNSNGVSLVHDIFTL
jgi:hypothetical protein